MSAKLIEKLRFLWLRSRYVFWLRRDVLNDLARQLLSAIIRTSEHFHVFSTLLRLSVRMFGSGGKKRANTSSNCAAL